jgi:pantoate kinase
VKKNTRAFAPGHVTGFFAIDTDSPEILQKGSMGAGFSLDLGTVTTLFSHPTNEIILNPSSDEPAQVSQMVLDLMRSRHKSQENLKVFHDIKLPQGSGFGTSGAGAYSLALALEERWSKKPSPEAAAAVAHQAEVINQTGLGTVAGQWQGGFEIRIKPGAPLSSRVIGFDSDLELQALFTVFGPLPTKHKLSDPELRKKINQKGLSYVQELSLSPSLDNFLRMSREFSEYVNLITPAIRSVFDILDQNKIISSQLMFGEGLFALLDPEQCAYWENSLSQSFPQARVFSTSISHKGGSVIEH